MYFQPHQSNRNEFSFFHSSKESNSSKFNEKSDSFGGLVRSTKEMQNRILAIWRNCSSKKKKKIKALPMTAYNDKESLAYIHKIIAVIDTFSRLL